MEILKARVARNLKRHRERMGLTQVEFAELAGYDWKSYQRWESGANLPRQEVVEDFAEALGTTTAELYGIEADANDDIESVRNEVRELGDRVNRLTRLIELKILHEQSDVETVPREKLKRILDEHGVTLTELSRRMGWLLPDGRPDPTKAGRMIGWYGKRLITRSEAEALLKELKIPKRELDRE